MYKHKPSPFEIAVTRTKEKHQITREDAIRMVVEKEKKVLTHKERREFTKRVKQYSKSGKSQFEAEISSIKNIMNSRGYREYVHKTTSTKRNFY